MRVAAAGDILTNQKPAYCLVSDLHTDNMDFGLRMFRAGSGVFGSQLGDALVKTMTGNHTHII